ncbi:unnamed protein product [Heterobilharzia americana]|nr:unnamed protein product [Heterobilharzia americana]
MSSTPRTPHRACRKLTIARIAACLNSPQGFEYNLSDKQVLSSKPDSRPRPRRATCLATLNSPVRKLSALHLSSPQKTPKPSMQASCIKIRKGDAVNRKLQRSLNESEDSSDEDFSLTNESSFTEDESSDSSGFNAKLRFKVRSVSRKPPLKLFSTRNTLFANKKNSTPGPQKRTLSQVPVFNLGSKNSEYGWLPGREQEFENIYTFIFNKLSQNSGGCMYISGVPGTGKTASVHAVLSTMHKLVVDSSLESQIPAFQAIYVNGMRVNDPKQIYMQIYEQLTGLTATSKCASELLEREFCHTVIRKTSHGEDSNKPVILVIDELDLLCTRRQDILYSLFDWPTRQNSRRTLVVLAIANTMDLPERLLHPRVASRLGLTRLTFAPYSHEQLTRIVRHRLSSLSDLFQPRALELASRKVAAVSVTFDVLLIYVNELQRLLYQLGSLTKK